MPEVDQKGQSLAFGGQALVEGIMMRSRGHVVMCIRQPDKEILMHREQISLPSHKSKIGRLPFIRGILGLAETLYVGVKGIHFSANAVLDEGERLSSGELAAVVALACGLASLFFVVPFLLANLLNLGGFLFNIGEAIVRLGMFLLYLAIVGMWGEFRRVLQYHGAEHKAINAYESGAELGIDSVKRFPRFHPRCGTSFIFIVMLVSIVLFSIAPDLGFFHRLAYRVLLIPVIGALSYELLRLSGKYRNSPITRALTMPGLAFQTLTTREPDDEMVEVAIKAVEEVVRLESPEDRERKSGLIDQRSSSPQGS